MIQRAFRSTVFLPCVLLAWAAWPPASHGVDARIPLESIRDSAREVMGHNDYRSVRRRVLEQTPEHDLDDGFLTGLMESIGHFLADMVGPWLTSFFDFLGSLLPDWGSAGSSSPPGASGSSSSGSGFEMSSFLLAVVLALVLSLVIWLVSRIVISRREDPDRRGIPSVMDAELEICVPPGELAASTYESRAIRFAERGNHAAAIRELLLGSMSWIERAGLIRFRKGLTNRDYVRAVWREEDRRQAYLVTGTEFELVYFGRRTATSVMFDRCLAAFQGAFREETTTTPAAV